MKKLFFYLLPVICLCVLFSCTKKNNTSITRFMTATVQGSPFKASVVTPTLSRSDTTSHLDIEGYDPGTGQRIVLRVPYNKTTGSFIIDNDNVNASYTSAFEDVAASGQITLQNITANTIEGTFNFITADSTKVTNGTFNVATP